jgi:hypothetical protein
LISFIQISNLKEEFVMKGFKKILLLSFTLSLVMGSLYSTGWAEEYFGKDDPVAQGWGALDLLVARPIGLAAAVVGTGVFVVSLPITGTVDIVSIISSTPAHTVGDSARMFMLSPLKFSFVREFPDENI